MVNLSLVSVMSKKLVVFMSLVSSNIHFFKMYIVKSLTVLPQMIMILVKKKKKKKEKCLFKNDVS